MATARSFHADDPDQDAADIARCERDLARLQYAKPNSRQHAEQIRRLVFVTERELARLKGNAA